jgi:hypothetical protein
MLDQKGKRDNMMRDVSQSIVNKGENAPTKASLRQREDLERLLLGQPDSVIDFALALVRAAAGLPLSGADLPPNPLAPGGMQPKP